MHWIISRISSNLQGLQNQFGLHFVTRSGKASLRFLSSHETLYYSCTKSLKGYFSSILNARNELTSQMYLLINKLHSFKDLYRSLIFLKWTTRNRWSNIGNSSQSSLEQRAIFLSTKDTQRLDGTISHVDPSCIPRKLCSPICWRNLPQRNRSESTNVDV
jgi:hypothetical protein